MRTPAALMVLSLALLAEDGKLRLLTSSEWQAALAPATAAEDGRKVQVDWILSDAEGVALSGYDLVSFFTGPVPVKGKASIAGEYRKVAFRFATAANRTAFMKDPESFLPRYGGFCAYSVAKGQPVPGNPGSWRILSGKLYFLESPAIMMTWERDQPLLEAAAQSRWPRLHR